MQFTLASMLAAAAFLPSAMAHYNFDKLIVDGTVTEAYEYIRRMTNSNSPVTDVTSTDMRCNVGSEDNAASTKTYPVTAGAEVGFTVADVIGHPGPLTIWMSQAPGNVSEYDGSGDWFKIYEAGTSSITSDGLQWASSNWKNFTFNLPSELADGQYLLRVEHVGLHGASTYGGAQFYISCAQIEVSGGSGGTPSPTATIPGVYDGNEPGLLINIYWPIPTNYTIAGPAVWPASTGSSSSGSAGSSSPAASSTVAAEATTSAAVAVSSSSSAAAATSAVAAVTSVAPVSSSVPTTLVTSARPVSSSTPASSAAAPAVTEANEEEEDCE